jgi:hypothetical protein
VDIVGQDEYGRNFVILRAVPVGPSASGVLNALTAISARTGMCEELRQRIIAYQVPPVIV